jgi:hypothetical protein
MAKLDDWLETIGLDRYAEAFSKNDITFDLLPLITDEHLKELDVSLGNRIRFLEAVKNSQASQNTLIDDGSSDAAVRRIEDCADCDLRRNMRRGTGSIGKGPSLSEASVQNGFLAPKADPEFQDATSAQPNLGYDVEPLTTHEVIANILGPEFEDVASAQPDLGYDVEPLTTHEVIANILGPEFDDVASAQPDLGYDVEPLTTHEVITNTLGPEKVDRDLVLEATHWSTWRGRELAKEATTGSTFWPLGPKVESLEAEVTSSGTENINIENCDFKWADYDDPIEWDPEDDEDLVAIPAHGWETDNDDQVNEFLARVIGPSACPLCGFVTRYTPHNTWVCQDCGN